jgi:hypothetical protein
MYRFKNLLVALLPEESKLSQGDNAADPMVLVVRPLRAPAPPSTGCCDTAVSIDFRVPGDKGDPPDSLWNYLSAEVAGAVLATDRFEEVGDLDTVDSIEVIEKKLAGAQAALRERKTLLQKQPMASK